MDINWYPGHMAKAKRLLADQLSRVDVVVELCDARLPYSSRNPDLDKLLAGKKRVLLLNKADLADPAATSAWLNYFRAQGIDAAPYSASTGKAKDALAVIDRAAKEAVERAAQKGIRKTVKAMVVGVPNVGKSTFTNKLHGGNIAKTGDRPGVTRANQWVRITPYLDLLDTPGLLWPRLDDQLAARRLCYIGTVKDDVVDLAMLTIHLLQDMLKGKNEQCHLLGDILRYYNLSGKVKAVSTSHEKRVFPVEFYVETMSLPAVKVTDDKTNEVMEVQLSTHPRGVLVSFLAEFEPMEEKTFTYEEQPASVQTLFTRTAWVGAERVRDIINTYDTESYKLPYGMENDSFKISWKVGEGITSFYNKKAEVEMCKPGLETFFTPVYERTKIRKGVYEERRLIGRNIRGLHAEQYQGDLKDVKVLNSREFIVAIREKLENM